MSRLTRPLSRTSLRAAALIAAAAALPSVAGAQCTGFTMSSSTGATITPGTTDIGNHGDDVTTNISLPFPITLYGAAYSTAVVSSNGTMQFTTNSNSFSNACLPQAATLGVALLPHWDDLRTDQTGNGIFTSVTGTAPNRVFNVEWRAVYFNNTAQAVNFEIRFYEDQTNSRIEYVYGTVAQNGTSATVGAEHTTFPPTQFECNTGGLNPGMMVTLTCTNGPIPPGGTGAANPTIAYACGTGSTVLFTVAATPGFNPSSTNLAVSADLSSIGGSANQQFFDNATNGDVTSGDSTFSFRAPILASVTPGNKSITFTVSDAQGRTNTGVIGLTVNGCPTAGPDVTVFDVIDVQNYGVLGNITAFAVGTNACNIGDVPVGWFSGGTGHPVIAQNMFRLKNGRFEQLGQSWLKHGFASTNSPGCGTCQQPPQGGSQLGVGCTDAYGSGLNGSQGNLGPRSTVNATTGVYAPLSGGGGATAIDKRLQVYSSDIDPAQNSGARYFVDTHYVTADDAQWAGSSGPGTNGLNNASWREVSASTLSNQFPTLTGTTTRWQPGIYAWRAVDPAVQIANFDYTDTSLGGNGLTARFVVAAKATDNGNGTWHYEYAVYNFNANRNGGSFSIPVPAGVTVSNIGFHGVFAHSGEPYPNTAANPDNWNGVFSNGAVTWTAPEPYSPGGETSANALRWGTMYNFRFDATTGPRTGTATLGLFVPGTPAAITGSLPVPNTRCGPADFNGDGVISVQDIFDFLAAYFANDPRADFNHAGGVTVQDIFDFLAAYFAGCP